MNFSLPPPRRWSSRRGARGDERWRGESAESRGSARPSRESERRRPGPSRRPSEPKPRPRRVGGAASRRTGGPIRRASGRNASLAIGYGATPRPWASAEGKVVGSGRGVPGVSLVSELRPWQRVSCQRSPRPALAVLPVALGVLDTDSVTAWGCIGPFGPFLRCAHHDPDLEPTIEAVGVVARELECFPGSL